MNLSAHRPPNTSEINRDRFATQSSWQLANLISKIVLDYCVVLYGVTHRYFAFSLILNNSMPGRHRTGDMLTAMSMGMPWPSTAISYTLKIAKSCVPMLLFFFL